MVQKLSDGVVHKLPADLKKALTTFSGAREAWEEITPLARNEFICWVEDAKKDETRSHRINRAATEIAEGKKRPCCWIGCIHRTDKAVSPSVKGILSKRSKQSK